MTSEDPWRGRMRAVAGRMRRFPWNRAGALLGIVTLGFSEIFFSLIGENLSHFPSGSGFYFGLIVWAQVVPFIVLLFAEWGVIRLWGENRAFRIWRGVLYVVLFLSFLRQLQVHHPDVNRPIVLYHSIVAVILVTAAALILFLAAIRFRGGIHSYVSWLGIIGVVLTVAFIARTGVLTSASGAVEEEERPEVQKDLPNVFLLLFDEFAYDVLMKDGEIDREAFPHIASLADESLWFTNATTNHYFTVNAIPTLLTGYLNPSADAPTLFNRLPWGYDVRVRVSVGATRQWLLGKAGRKPQWVYLSSSDRLLQNPFEIPAFLGVVLARSPYAESPLTGNHYADMQQLPPMIFKDGIYTHALRDLEEFVDELREAPETPRFTFWHCWLPHHPFVLTPDGKVHDNINTTFKSAPRANRHLERNLRKTGKEYRVQEVWDNYVLQSRFVDHQVGRIVEALKSSGMYENSILVVTTDHGLRTWGEMEPEGHPDVLGSLAPKIPLMIRGPGVKPGVRTVDYQHLDLVATILDLVGHPEKASGTEGVSALSEERPDRIKKFWWKSPKGMRHYHRRPQDVVWRRTETQERGKGN